ncbi:MAG: molybdopterin-dependent oxidoreductase [Acidimicrobiales bacterium]
MTSTIDSDGTGNTADRPDAPGSSSSPRREPSTDRPRAADISGGPAAALPGTGHAASTPADAPLGGAVWAALAGLIAAAAALATGELFSGLSTSIVSLPVAIFDVLVDFSPQGITSWSRETFGTNQKTVTVVGIVATTLVLGAVVGVASRRNRRIGVGAFVAAGLFGGWAAARSPLGSAFWSWVAALTTIAVGVFVLTRLLRWLPGSPADVADHRTADGAEAQYVGPAAFSSPARRRFLGVAGGAALFALFGSAVGRALRNGQNVESARTQVAAQLGGSSGGVLDSPSTVLDAVPASETFDAVEGISALVTPNDDFYRIDTAFSPPQVDPGDWNLTIMGMVDNEVTLTFDDLLAMDQIEEVITLSCVSNEVGGGLVGNAVWTGVPLSTLLDMAGVQDGATQIVGRSVDDWTGGFPTEVAYDGRPAMVALTMNGEPLPVRHGFPARLVVPGLYGYVSATKWLKEIELTTWEGYDGYWIPRGWAKEGPIKTQSRIDVPSNGATVPAGPTAVAGVAWAGKRSVDRVEVRIDDGDWIEATLSGELSENSWRQWMISWDATPGDHTIQVRATDGLGETQPPERTPVAPDGATGHHTIGVRVA